MLAAIRDIFLLALLAVVCVLGFHYVFPQFSEDLSARNRTEAGTVQDISVKEAFWSDTTTLRLNSGKVVVLKGTFNPWQPGESVTQPVKKAGDSKKMVETVGKTWCIRNQCLQQK
ncbi:hypothetical protein WDK74_22090 [Escherichia coli]